MADIDIQRKQHSIWPWILGLLLLGLLIWGIMDWTGEDAEAAAEPVVVTEPGPTPVAAGTGIVVSEIIASPATWTGRTVAGEVRVVGVPTDRGFWIEDQGQRLFAVLGEPPRPGETINIQSGQALRVREARVYGAAELANLPGQLDPDTRRIAEGQPVVLGIEPQNIEILGQAAS
jgi:hypothetical protein